MIRLVRLFAGPDGRSHVEESTMRLDALGPDAATGWLATTAARFQQSPPGSQLAWHDAPRRQYVVTLTGTLEFTTRDGETFRLGPGDVLLAEDTAGGGHRWRLLDDQPWTRVYLQLP
ncbi:cupin domain-containing protein [Catellatospora sichuanensis]|uniref:cupin domain-containing protein n=1 Tax=Catellatospora sichuanensis TaxID=1969805 RepID=UPI001181DCA7|nr:cupin domain-containing protein [Catellatospora sichuanensis]